MKTSKTIIGVSCVLAVAAGTTSCKQKQNEDEIIVEKIIDKPQSKATNMGATSKVGKISWAGAGYEYSVRRVADPSSGEINNHDSLFHDNRIELTIKRTDGSQFFSQVFTKSSFSGLLSNDMQAHGILLSLVYDKCDAGNVYFVATIGSPDEAYDDFTLVQLIINRQGATSVAGYTPPEIEN